MNIEKNDEYISVLFSGNLEYVLTSVLRMDQGLFGFNAKSTATKCSIVGASLAYGKIEKGTVLSPKRCSSPLASLLPKEGYVTL